MLVMPLTSACTSLNRSARRNASEMGVWDTLPLPAKKTRRSAEAAAE